MKKQNLNIEKAIDMLSERMCWIIKKTQALYRAYCDEGVRGVGNKTLFFINRHIAEYRLNQILSENCKEADKGKAAYDSVFQEDVDFRGRTTDVKALAFYLPQFHTFPENDMWWGKGFTEWTNTRKGMPQFEGHYQPRVPHADIGYYDLTDIEVMRKQAEMAKKHGIWGFCFYYYWFSGKRLMEKPVDYLLEHPEIDMPFCLCWANENWTRTWDGLSQNVLIKQEYTIEDRNLFIEDLKKYIADPRYIRIKEKPLILVYDPSQIPDCKEVFEAWRIKAREEKIGEILIWICRKSNCTAESLGLLEYIDGEVDFPPHNMCHEPMRVKNVKLSNGKSAVLFSYKKLVKTQEVLLKYKTRKEIVPVHHTCTMGWDNAARRSNDWLTLYGFSLKYLYRWMRAIVKNARVELGEEERFVFINAWNEWAEGTYLEPDEKYGSGIG